MLCKSVFHVMDSRGNGYYRDNDFQSSWCSDEDAIEKVVLVVMLMVMMMMMMVMLLGC